MFGFLRRKTPAAPVAAPVETPVVATAVTPVDTPADTPIVTSAPTEPLSAEALSAPQIQTQVAAQVVAPVVDAASIVQAPAERGGWYARLQKGLSKTRSNLSGIFSRVKIDEDLYEALETALLSSDTGVEATTFVLTELREHVRRERLTDADQVKQALKTILLQIVKPLERGMDIDRASPLVIMISGVNGAGKTTSIGKLTKHFQHAGKSVLLAAGDTFRAAAREQLAQWGERNNVTVIAQDGGDPAAVAFDSVSAATARKIQVAIIDTAGRLPTQQHLMEELKKIGRVIGKADPTAPHESLLVLDGNTGQNMLGQVKAFDAAVPLTGLIVTKLDGTAKGGALVALARSHAAKPIPVYFIGVGEGIDDLQAFSADEFVSALIG